MYIGRMYGFYGSVMNPSTVHDAIDVSYTAFRSCFGVGKSKLTVDVLPNIFLCAVQYVDFSLTALDSVTCTFSGGGGEHPKSIQLALDSTALRVMVSGASTLIMKCRMQAILLSSSIYNVNFLSGLPVLLSWPRQKDSSGKTRCLTTDKLMTLFAACII